MPDILPEGYGSRLFAYYYASCEDGNSVNLLSFIPNHAIIYHMQVHQLIYQSSLSVTSTSAYLQQLLPTWRASNHAAAISGLLLYGEEGVMQVLEGPADQVHKMYERIARDQRHYDVCVLADYAVPARAFAQWSMGFVHLEAPDLNRLASYVSFAQPARLLPTQPEQWPELMSLLQEFITREQNPFAS